MQKRRRKISQGECQKLQFVNTTFSVHFFSSNLQIADFGLSQELTNTITEEGRYSHRWAAPEIFPAKDRKSPIKSTKSDVWAMGAVVWELWMECVPYGNTYPNAKQFEIITFIINEEMVKTFFC